MHSCGGRRWNGSDVLCRPAPKEAAHATLPRKRSLRRLALGADAAGAETDIRARATQRKRRGGHHAVGLDLASRVQLHRGPLRVGALRIQQIEVGSHRALNWLHRMVLAIEALAHGHLESHDRVLPLHIAEKRVHLVAAIAPLNLECTASVLVAPHLDVAPHHVCTSICRSLLLERRGLRGLGLGRCRRRRCV